MGLALLSEGGRIGSAGWGSKSRARKADRGLAAAPQGAVGPGAREQGLVCRRWCVGKINQVAECR